MNHYIKSFIDNETILKCLNHNIAASDADIKYLTAQTYQQILH